MRKCKKEERKGKNAANRQLGGEEKRNQAAEELWQREMFYYKLSERGERMVINDRFFMLRQLSLCMFIWQNLKWNRLSSSSSVAIKKHRFPPPSWATGLTTNNMRTGKWPQSGAIVCEGSELSVLFALNANPMLAFFHPESRMAKLLSKQKQWMLDKRLELRTRTKTEMGASVWKNLFPSHINEYAVIVLWWWLLVFDF